MLKKISSQDRLCGIFFEQVDSFSGVFNCSFLINLGSSAESVLSLLKNLRLPFAVFFGWRWVQTDKAQVGTSQKLPTHPFPRLQIQGGG
jgi:hypothetical protein